ncbi:MAG: GNAT family N-acetyltransferase [Anaerolineae bacterium]|nr:GNAT family N-acetyltransferase [Anaerolineae bacterium]
MSETILTTERLTLRPFTLDDLQDHHRAVFKDPDVMRYLPGGAPRTIDQSKKSTEYFVKHWAEHGYGLFAVIHRADDRLIGHCGLNVLKEDGSVEIAYAIAKPYWGQGLTTEASQAVVDHGFDVLKIAQIIGLAVPTNIASRRVMEKIGMKFQGITRDYYNMEFALYNITLP